MCGIEKGGDVGKLAGALAAVGKRDGATDPGGVGQPRGAAGAVETLSACDAVCGDAICGGVDTDGAGASGGAAPACPVSL